MKIQIKHRYTAAVIFECDAESMQENNIAVPDRSVVWGE